MKTPRLLICACLLVLTLSSNLIADIVSAPVKRKGRYVKTDIDKIEEINSFVVSMAHGQNNSTPVLLFRKKKTTILHLVRMYETILEIPGETDINAPNIEPKVIPNEYLPGETETQTEVKEGEPLAHETISVNGFPFVTDSEGRLVDTEQILLHIMDDLGKNSEAIHFSHETRGSQNLILTRNLLNKPASIAKVQSDVENTSHADLLEALGLDFIQLQKTSGEGLHISADVPKAVKDNDVIEITITAKNTGTLPVGAVIVRSFSRDPWLNGKLFYIGNLEPDRTISFKRLLKVSAEPHAETSFVTFCAWELLGKAAPKTPVFAIERQ